MANELPAADPGSPWMQELERAHRLAHEAARAIAEESEPSPHLTPAADELARAVAAMYDAFDGRSDRPTAINVASSRAWNAAVLVARAGMTGAVEALREACLALVEAEARFPRVPLAARATTPLRGSVDVLPLHVIERPSLRPTFPAPPVPAVEIVAPPPALPEPMTFAELAAVAKTMAAWSEETTRAARPAAPNVDDDPPASSPVPAPPPGFAVAPTPTVSDDDFLRGWARHCFEEIGMLGVQRTPLAGDAWRMSLPIERRMLHAIDAIAALGPSAVASLEPLALDAPAANPMAVFAIALLGGCLEGRDALGGAERVLHHFGPNDPVVAASFVSAMKLATSPFVPTMLRSLARSSEIGARAAAVEVLAARGWLTEPELEALVDEADPRLLGLALPVLAAGRHRALDRAIAHAIASPRAELQLAALDALALAAHGDAASSARAAADGPLGDDALVRVALVADASDAQWLLRRAQARPTPAAIEALGWAGLLDAVPFLLKILEGDEEDAKSAAAASLERLLGANLVELATIVPDEVEDVMFVDPDPDPPKPRASVAALTGDARDMPPAGAPEKLEVPTTDPERWRAYWLEHERSFDRTKRVRRGRPYSPSVSLYELDQLPIAPEERRALHRELAARTGRSTRFDPHDFVVVQERCLVAWSALVASAPEVPGSWARARRG